MTDSRAPDVGSDPAWPKRPPDWRHDAPDPPDAFSVPFSVRDGLLAAAWTIFAQILVQLPLVIVGFDFENTTGALAVAVATQIFTLAGVLAWLHAKGTLSWRLLGPIRPRLRHIAVGLGVGLLGVLFVFATLQFIDALFGPIEQPSQSLLESTISGTPAALVLGLISVVLIGPVVEEVVYRGLLFQALRQRLGVFPGIGLSSLTFAAVHVELYTSPASLAALTLLAVWLAGAFHRTGTLLVPTIGHAVFNGVVITAALTMQGSPAA